MKNASMLCFMRHSHSSFKNIPLRQRDFLKNRLPLIPL